MTPNFLEYFTHVRTLEVSSIEHKGGLSGTRDKAHMEKEIVKFETRYKLSLLSRAFLKQQQDTHV